MTRKYRSGQEFAQGDQRCLARRLGIAGIAVDSPGLLTMPGVADATNAPLIHKDADLLDILADVFDSAARNQE